MTNRSSHRHRQPQRKTRQPRLALGRKGGLKGGKARAKKLTNSGKIRPARQHRRNGAAGKMSRPMFDHKHYVPIIKSKAGELWTLRHLGGPAKDRTTPLLEVLSHKSFSDAVPHERVCDSIAAGWGTKHRLFIDTIHLGTQTAAHAASLNHYFVAADKLGVQAVPVTSLGRSQAYQHAIQRIVSSDGHGAALRLSIRDFVDPDVLAKSVGGFAQSVGTPSTESGRCDRLRGSQRRSGVDPGLSRLHLRPPTGHALALVNDCCWVVPGIVDAIRARPLAPSAP